MKLLKQLTITEEKERIDYLDLELKCGMILNDNIVSPEDEGFLKGEYEFSFPLENPPW